MTNLPSHHPTLGWCPENQGKLNPGHTDETACETTTSASRRLRTYCAHAAGRCIGRRWLEMERAMGIEPTGKAVLGLENKRFGAIAETKCDWRVNFRGTWGYVGIRERSEE